MRKRCPSLTEQRDRFEALRVATAVRSRRFTRSYSRTSERSIETNTLWAPVDETVVIQVLDAVDGALIGQELPVGELLATRGRSIKARSRASTSKRRWGRCC